MSITLKLKPPQGYECKVPSQDYECRIPYCNAMRCDDYLYEIKVPCEIVATRSRLWFCNSRLWFCNRETEYSLSVRFDEDYQIIKECSINDNVIKISGDATHCRVLSFLINRNLLTTDKHNIRYKIELLKGEQVAATLTASLTLCREQICSQCESFYRDAICEIVPVVETIHYSDVNYNDRKLHIANLRISDVKQCDFYYPASIDITYTVCYNNDRYDMVEPYSLNLTGGSHEEVPLYVDMKYFSCPEKDNGKLAVKVCCTTDNKCVDRKTFSCEAFIPFLRDERYNKLAVSIRDGAVESSVLRGSENNLTDIELLNAVGHLGNVIIEKQLVFRNLATGIVNVPGANGIRVQNFKIEMVSDLSRIEGATVDELRNEWNCEEREFVLSPNSPERIFPIRFNLSKIKNVRCVNHSRKLKWEARVSFNYKEDRYVYRVNEMGENVAELITDNGNWRKFDAVLSTNLLRCPPNCYYSVDFGTSAVVVYKMFKDLINNYNPPLLVDLKTIKNNLLLAQYPDDETKRKDNSESASNIIASTVYLNHLIAQSGDALNTDYKNARLWFSPSSEMTRPDCLYPCLKYMVGNSTIPPIPTPANMNRKNIPHCVQEIIKTAYEQLCRLYLQNGSNVEDGNNIAPIESLVLTVPNSFTPVHIAQIRKAVMDNIPSLADEMLEFVSESDSVLCSYISDTQESAELIRKRRADGENILIYDMGAGTLDVTYAKCSIVNIANNGERIQVEIIAKKGVARAGDYIDYLLGEIILDLLEKHNVKPLTKQTFERVLSIVPNTRSINYKELKNLKSYLRNKVKPILKKGNANVFLPPTEQGNYRLFNIPEITKLGEIRIGEILEHAKFTSYIESCTKEIIEDITACYGTDMGLGTKRLLLDTLILSGRMSSLEAISDALKKSVDEYKPKRTMVSYKEFAGDKVSQKTVVAKGALDYIRLKGTGIEIIKKPVYGKYGLIIKKTNTSDSDWELLADENVCLPFSKVFDISIEDVNQVQLVHSSSYNPLLDANRVILHRLEIPEHRNNNRKRVTFNINSDTTMSYTISNSDGTNPIPFDLQPHDDYYSSDLRKSLWPVIYDNK